MSTTLWLVVSGIALAAGYWLGRKSAKGEIAAVREARKRDWAEWEGILARRGEWP
jgi:hypothetical protein